MRKTAAIWMSIFLLGVFITLAYVFVAVKNVYTLNNFVPVAIFEGILFLLLVGMLISRLFSVIAIGFSVQLTFTTILLAITSSSLNLIYVDQLEKEYFILMNITLILLYCLVSLPIYIMGKSRI